MALANSLLADSTGSILLFENNQDSLFSVDGNRTLVVDPSSFTITPQTDELLDGGSGEPLASADETLISQYPGFPISVRKKLVVKPTKFELFGEILNLNVSAGFTLSIANNGDELTIGKTPSNKIYVSKTVSTQLTSYGINPRPIAIRKLMNVSRAEFWTDKPQTELRINGLGDTLLVNATDPLGIDQYKVFAPRVSKYLPVTSAQYYLQPYPVSIYQQEYLSIARGMYGITPYPITIDKVLNLPAQTGQYRIESFGINFKPNLIPESRYIRDSSNFYILYVDEGADYYIKIDTERLGLETNANIQFHAEFARTSDSLTKYEIQITKIDSKTIRLDIDRDTSIGLYGRFKFNIMATRPNGMVSKFIRGDVIINQTISG